jgi:RimJ/RimL family protein N-acetyltransferase
VVLDPIPWPSEPVDGGILVLRTNGPQDAGPIARAVAESLEHLRPWLPWATPTAAKLEAQCERIEQAEALGDARPERAYVMLRKPDHAIVGMCGLHRRIGPAGLEIGYWVHVGHTGRGYATAAARALTDAAWALPAIQRMEIHCDEANLPSQAVPRRLGYRLDRIEDDRIKAPAETGRSMIWVIDRPSAERGPRRPGSKAP